jgi:hypothetical protein
MLGRANLLYKMSRTADKGLCCSWGLDVGLSDLLTLRHSILFNNLILAQLAIKGAGISPVW